MFRLFILVMIFGQMCTFKGDSVVKKTKDTINNYNIGVLLESLDSVHAFSKCCYYQFNSGKAELFTNCHYFTALSQKTILKSSEYSIGVRKEVFKTFINLIRAHSDTFYKVNGADNRLVLSVNSLKGEDLIGIENYGICINDSILFETQINPFNLLFELDSNSIKSVCEKYRTIME